MKAFSSAALILVFAVAPAFAQDVLVVAGANDAPNTLINGVFNGTTLTYNAEIPTGGDTSGVATSLAFNQTRASVSTAPGGCTLVATTNNSTNNVSVFSVSGTTLTAVSGSPFAAGAGVQSLAWAPDGGALYVPLAVTGASQVVTFTVSCTAGVATLTNAGTVSVAGFSLLRDAEVIGASGPGTHLCLSATTSNNVGCTAIDPTTRLPQTTTVNTVTVTNVRGMRIAPNGCGAAGVGSAATVSAFSVAANGTVTLTNTAAAGTAPRYGAISRDGTLVAFGGFGTQFTVFSMTGACALAQVGVDTGGPASSLVEYMAFDATNRLYVSDSLGNRIRVFAPTTAAIGPAITTATTNHATTNAPGGIDVLPAGPSDVIFEDGFEL